MEKITIVAVTRCISTDLITPISLFMRLCRWRDPFFLLESAGENRELGRFSYIGMDPLNLESLLGPYSLPDADNALQRITYQEDARYPNLLSGIVGHVSYHGIEDVFPLRLRHTTSAPGHQFFLARSMVVLDHLKKDLILVRNLINPTEKDRSDAQRELESMAVCILAPEEAQLLSIPQCSSDLVFRSSFSKTGFIKAVNRAKDYILRGDIFQVVLSQQFTAEGAIDGFSLYRHLRRTNPAPYLSYLRFPEFEVLCSSPEMLVRTDDNHIETVPIAGTRPVMHDGRDDERAVSLLADEKELAEHLMLVDLGRNDIGKVSMPGSVAVTEFCQVQRFASVMHLVSKVRGTVKPGTGAIRSLLSAFPAGTVTGAPKLRAMEIIDELESVPRGLYAGAIVILDPAGRLNSCIAIRTITLKNNVVTLQAGAGIVHDSDPEAEYQETLNKAESLFKAIEASTSGGVTYAFND